MVESGEGRPGVDLDLERIVRSAAGPLLSAFLPRPRDPVDELRARLLAVQLSKELEGSAVPVVQEDLEELIGEERQDWVLMGVRGAGKTAAGVTISQQLGKVLNQDVYALGWPGWALEAIGAKSAPGAFADLTDCVLLVDEAFLRVGSGRRQKALFELLALGRHRQVSVVWTSQGLHSLHIDVLRMSPRLGLKRLDPLAVRYDREEASDLLATAVALQSRFEELATVQGLLVHFEGGWYATRNQLPEGWSERVSRVWR